MSSNLSRRARYNVPSPNPERTSYARFIPREELGDYATWTPGGFGQPPQGARPARPAAAEPAAPPAPSAEQLRAELEAAQQRGYEQGYRDGLTALEGFKQSHAQQVNAHLAQFMQSLDAEFDGLHEELAAAVARIATQLARQVLRSELQTAPEHVAHVAAEAVESLLHAARHITVLVHPQDLPLVAAGAEEVLQARGARLVAHAQIARGGCRVESDAGSIEADIATRWEQAARTLGSALGWEEPQE